MIGTGRANVSTPIRAHIEPTIFPGGLSGTKSPYLNHDYVGELSFRKQISDT